ncbi:conserved hypothetical protein [Vibrio phage 393E50-1]|nr:conserved hypothetical protein [Vibrio phage 393E50-1]
MDSNQEQLVLHSTPESRELFFEGWEPSNKNALILGRQTGKTYSTRQLMKNMVDTKGQQTVSLTRIAKELGVEPLTQQEISQLIEDRK